MKPITQLVACFFLTLSLAVFAGDEDEFGEIRKLMSQSPNTEKNRKALASRLLLHWERIDKAVPRLSPAEKKWLKKELDTLRGKVWERREFAQDRALFMIEQLILALKAIERSDGIKKEIGRWALVYRQLSDRDLYLYLSGLVKLGVVSPPPNTFISEEIPLAYLAVSNHILDRIIIGYLLRNEN